MENHKNLPAIQTNADDLTIEQKRDFYKKEVEKYQSELAKDLKALKRDASILLIIGGTAYAAYRITRYFLKSNTQNLQQTPQSIQQPYSPPSQNGHISSESKTEKPKKSFSIKNFIRRKLTAIALDLLTEKLQEELTKYSKKNAK